MNPGEVWRLEDGSLRLVLSNATYNSSALDRVITVVVGDGPSGFDPFAVATGSGTAYADRIAMHPRDWLVDHVATVGDTSLGDVRAHLSFLLIET